MIDAILYIYFSLCLFSIAWSAVRNRSFQAAGDLIAGTAIVILMIVVLIAIWPLILLVDLRREASAE